MREALFFCFKQKKVQDEVIYLNTDDQLYSGIDAEGKPLASIGGDYSPTTVAIKNANGQPTDRVTLLDTGEFYGSFKVTAEKDGILIEADTVKANTDLQDRWGENLLGLTDENKGSIAQTIKPLVKDYILSILLGK